MVLETDPFCPVCKTENPAGVSACVFCSHPLDPAGPEGQQPAHQPAPAAARRPSRNSLVIFVSGFVRPIQIDGCQTVILGRNLERSSGPQGEPILDLSPFEALDRGVSRQHAIVRPVAGGFEICDMGSTNGTWLNQVRILPGRPYRLERESEIRLGRMVVHLFVRQPGGQTSSLAG